MPRWTCPRWIFTPATTGCHSVNHTRCTQETRPQRPRDRAVACPAVDMEDRWEADSEEPDMDDQHALAFADPGLVP